MIESELGTEPVDPIAQLAPRSGGIGFIKQQPVQWSARRTHHRFQPRIRYRSTFVPIVICQANYVRDLGADT